MQTSTTDDRRRIVMPAECPPNCSVSIQEIEEGTWVVKLIKDRQPYRILLLPLIERLPDDPAWEKIEAKIARHTADHAAPFKE
ncbi:MAG: hypothetical protein ACLP7I_12125 [Limisphaerales bacterium]